MKTLITLAVALLITTSTFAATVRNEGNGTPARSKNLFVVKTQKRFAGATIEVVSAHGEVIAVERLQKRKVIIDFGTAPSGTYTIKVSKDNAVQEFQYTRK